MSDDVEKTIKEKIMDRLKTIKQKATRVALLGKYIILKSSTWKDVPNLIKERGYPGERITRVHILDLNTHITLKIGKGGKISSTDFLDEFKNRKPDFEVSVVCFKDLFYIRVGLKPGINQGEVILMPYSPIYAWAHDDIRVHGPPCAANEVRGASDLFTDFIQRIPVKDLARICEMTKTELVMLGLVDVAKEIGLME